MGHLPIVWYLSSNLAGIESGPVALYDLMFFSNFSTPGMVTIIGSMVLCVHERHHQPGRSKKNKEVLVIY
jgi:uncharacterized membrane protein